MSTFSLGLDLGGTNARAALVDEQGRIAASHKVALVSRSIDDVVEALGTCADEACRKSGIARDRLRSIGAGVAGQIDARTNRILVSPNLGFRDVDLAGPLSARLGRDVTLANDLAAATLGEATHGAAKGHADALLVFVGSGIGAGFVLGGRPYRGTRGVGGELGHVKVVKDGRRCGCGEDGCLEAYAGGHNLARRAIEAAGRSGPTRLSAFGDALTTTQLLTLADDGDALAIALRDEAADLVAFVAANVVTLLNPSIVILGGGVLLGSDAMRARVKAGLESLCSRVSAAGLVVTVPVLGDDAGVIGAAAL